MITINGKEWDSSSAPTIIERKQEQRNRRIQAQSEAMTKDKGKVMSELLRALNDQANRINGEGRTLRVESVQRSGDTFVAFVSVPAKEVTSEIVKRIQGGLLLSYIGASEWSGGAVLTYMPACEEKGGAE